MSGLYNISSCEPKLRLGRLRSAKDNKSGDRNTDPGLIEWRESQTSAMKGTGPGERRRSAATLREAETPHRAVAALRRPSDAVDQGLAVKFKNKLLKNIPMNA